MKKLIWIMMLLYVVRFGLIEYKAEDIIIGNGFYTLLLENGKRVWLPIIYTTIEEL